MALTKYAKGCSKNVPGNSRIFFAEIGNIDTITLTSGAISDITMATSTKFMEFGAEIDSVQLTQEGKGKWAYSEVKKLVAKFAKKTPTLVSAKNALVDAVVCGVAIIRIDNNGCCWLSGWDTVNQKKRPYNQIDVNFDSGTKISDEEGNMLTITLTCESTEDEIPFDTTLTATIVGGTATFIDYNS